LPFDAHEAEGLHRMVAFVRAHSDCFERSCVVGHVTGSAWLLNRARTHVLLTHHRKLGKWLQLGGHADGDPDVMRVALREAREESGLDSIVPLSDEIFDVDVHVIPAREADPEHLHYDVRFLLQSRGSDRFHLSDESHQLAWVSAAELPSLDTDESVLRMYRKWQALK
jgi:8-oxo-dGTP pyrophosphatase MutT (NUDIX family)